MKLSITIIAAVAIFMVFAPAAVLGEQVSNVGTKGEKGEVGHVTHEVRPARYPTKGTTASVDAPSDVEGFDAEEEEFDDSHLPHFLRTSVDEDDIEDDYDDEDGDEMNADINAAVHMEGMEEDEPLGDDFWEEDEEEEVATGPKKVTK